MGGIDASEGCRNTAMGMAGRDKGGCRQEQSIVEGTAIAEVTVEAT